MDYWVRIQGLVTKQYYPVLTKARKKRRGHGNWVHNQECLLRPLIILLSPHFHISSLGSMLLSAFNFLNSVATSSYTNFLCQQFRILFWFCDSFFLTSIFLMTIDPWVLDRQLQTHYSFPLIFGASLSFGAIIFLTYIYLFLPHLQVYF